MYSDFSNDEEANGSDYSNERHYYPDKRRHERKSNEGKRSRSTDDQRYQHLEDIEDRRSRATDDRIRATDDRSRATDERSRATDERSRPSDDRRNQQLEDRLVELENMNKKLKSQLMEAQRSRSRSSKGNIRRDNDWSAEEGRLADKIVPFCKNYLFPRYKFLRDNWMDYDPENENSFCHFVGKKMNGMYKNMRIRISGPQFKREWEDVYVPLIGLKYSNMRCNLSNDIRSQYFGKFKVWMISY
jgi:hypothetical protein